MHQDLWLEGWQCTCSIKAIDAGCQSHADVMLMWACWCQSHASHAWVLFFFVWTLQCQHCMSALWLLHTLFLFYTLCVASVFFCFCCSTLLLHIMLFFCTQCVCLQHRKRIWELHMHMQHAYIHKYIMCTYTSTSSAIWDQYCSTFDQSSITWQHQLINLP